MHRIDDPGASGQVGGYSMRSCQCLLDFRAGRSGAVSGDNRTAPHSIPELSGLFLARFRKRQRIYAGQPGYSSKLNRDGDGVATETGGGGGGSVSSSEGPAVRQLSRTCRATGPASQAPVVSGSATGQGYTTVATRTAANCIDITAPSAAAGTLQTSLTQRRPGPAYQQWAGDQNGQNRSGHRRRR